MATSLSDFVDNLSGVYDEECKRCMERNKIRLNFKMVDWIINTKNAKYHALS